MIDIEKAIQKRIELSRTYITPLMNPAIVRHHEIAIKTLQTAPRTEPELLKEMQRVKWQIDRTISTLEAAPLHDKLDALEWLLPKIRLQHEAGLTDNNFV
jgi:hypothetical protein